MDYKQFIEAMQNYWTLRDKGSKKTANEFLSSFVKEFQKNIPEEMQDAILFQFCKEYIDEMKYLDDGLRRHFPFPMMEMIKRYLNRECEKNKMPQMRWTFQLFENYNPQHFKNGRTPHAMLEKAYLHEQCDQRTIDLYLNEQMMQLWWGQHHFPKGALITKDEFEAIVRTIHKILSEKSAAHSLEVDFNEYVKLYRIYFAWEEAGKNSDFYALCADEGIACPKPLVTYARK